MPQHTYGAKDILEETVLSCHVSPGDKFQVISNCHVWQEAPLPDEPSNQSLFRFEARSHVAQATLELLILLPLSPEWHYEHTPTHWRSTVSFFHTV